MTKVLILGANGQLGHRLFLDLSALYPTYGMVRKLSKNLSFFMSDPAKLLSGYAAEDFPAMEEQIEEIRPDVIVNCIGVIKQRQNMALDKVREINSEFPKKLDSLCRRTQRYLIHFSTDCVFSGKKGNYSEDDRPDAEDLYGQSKFEGEISDSPNTLTLRTSIIGRELDHHSSLADWFFSQPAGGKVMGFKKAVFSRAYRPIE